MYKFQEYYYYQIMKYLWSQNLPTQLLRSMKNRIFDEKILLLHLL